MKKTIFHFRTKNTKEAAAAEKEEKGEEEEEEEKDEKEGEEVEILAGLAKSALGTHVPRTRNWLRCHCAADSLHGDGHDGRRRRQRCLIGPHTMLLFFARFAPPATN